MLGAGSITALTRPLRLSASQARKNAEVPRMPDTADRSMRAAIALLRRLEPDGVRHPLI